MSVNQKSGDTRFQNEGVGGEAQCGVLKASEEAMGGSRMGKGLQTSRGVTSGRFHAFVLDYSGYFKTSCCSVYSISFVIFSQTITLVL